MSLTILVNRDSVFYTGHFLLYRCFGLLLLALIGREKLGELVPKIVCYAISMPRTRVQSS
jgi:hypothetical protein